jgi:drug/metabolite transporter (DMT)-like permease
MKWMFTFSALSSLPFTYSEFANFNFGNIPDLAIYGICFIVIGPTFISYLLLPIGQKNLRPTIISSYNYIQPVVSTIVAISWGLDNFNLLKIASILLIFIGVFMVSRSKSRVQIESELAEKSKKMIN